MDRNINALNTIGSSNQGNISNDDISKDNQMFQIIKGLHQDYKEVSGKNVFPIEVFPEEIQKLIMELKHTMNFPIDYSGCSILYAVSVSIGNKIQLKVKNGWIEKSILFFVLVGRTGDIKSHSISFFINDLIKIDQRNYHDYLQKEKEYENLNSEEKAEKTPPFLKQTILNDFTSEALVKSHYFNPRGIGLYADEIAAFFNGFNRYNKGSGDEELFLSLWAGKPVVKNRVTGDELRIDDTKIDIIGSIQEAILESVFRNSKMKNGFIDRILFGFPHEYVDIKWNDRELNQSVIDWYSQFITSIFTEADRNKTLMEFEEQAKNYLYSWQNSQKMIFDFEYQRGIAVKLQQYVLRFSIVLEIMRCFCENRPISKISIETVKSAIALRNYFFETAIRVFEAIDSNYFEGLTEVQKKVFEMLPDTFKTGEAKELILNQNLMKERSLKSFLNDRNLFKKVSNGLYEKQVI